MMKVMTNGCFDLLHGGHVRLLRFARSLGDSLVVALNSDDSVRRRKGPLRPIVPQSERADILRSLRCVDRVIVFDADRPLSVIHLVRPDVYVVGTEYIDQDSPEMRLVRQLGGRVEVPAWDITISTGSRIKDIAARYGACRPLS